MLRWRGLVRSIVAAGLALALSGVVVLAQDACTRTYRGDLVLEGNERLVITEGVLCVGGEIILRDNARLEISNATLRMSGFTDTIWDRWAHVHVQDDARLLLESTRIEAPGAGAGGVWIYATGSSSVEISGLRSSGAADLWLDTSGTATAQITDSTLREIRVRDRVNVNVSGTHVEWTANLQFSGRISVELTNLARRHYSEWEIPQGQGVGIRLRLVETYVGGWSVEVMDHAQLRVRDSEITRVIVEPARAPQEVSGMRPGYHANWELQDAMDEEHTGNLVLANTSVGHWLLNLHGVRRPLTVRDSSIEGLYIWDSSARVYLDRVSIGGLLVWRSSLTLATDPLTLTRGVELHSTRLTISGSTRVPDTASKVVWNNSSVGREYEVQVRDNDGDPVRGVSIGLEDPNGRISHRTTDQEGVVRFTIWFQNRNYDHTWHLLVPQGDTTARVPITLFTSTPVQVTSW